MIFFSCAVKKEYAFTNKGCKIENEIFEIGKDSMQIDTSLFANILANKDTVISTQGKKRIVFRKTLNSNFPEVTYMIAQRFLDKGIEIWTSYYDNGNLFFYNYYKFYGRDGSSGMLSHKFELFDKNGKRIKKQ